MKTYNVILHKGVDYQSFWNDMENDNDGGNLYIPNRKVDTPNPRPNSLRQTWYTLTEEEVELVRNDERVLAVEIPPEFRDDIMMMPRLVQTGDFTKTTSDSGNYINWGLIRVNSQTNNYGTGTTTSENYKYILDGSDVDVVIQDSGIEVNHPEFEDSEGNNRVQQIDWYSESGVVGTQSANHYRDYDGHGTHCAGIAVGKTYGWAKNANIYAQKLDGLEGSGDSGTGISISDAFDCIKGWHNNKSVNPKTGVKNPTVVNMSWGYSTFFNTVTSLTYRGTTHTDGSTTGNAAYRESNYGLISLSGAAAGFNFLCNTRISSVDTDIEEMIDAGIIICIAAGNSYHKIDISGGTDYNNNVVTDTGTKNYHRGSSPYSIDAFIVGNIDSTAQSSTLDYKANSSETGPGVNIYAPGTNIMSCTSTTNKWGVGSQNYYADASYRQTNISGTSMAAPQVAGVAALLLQLNPSLTPAEVKRYFITNSTSTIYDTGLDNDWGTFRSLKGGEVRVLYNKFNKEKSFTFSGFNLSGGIKFEIL